MTALNFDPKQPITSGSFVAKLEPIDPGQYHSSSHVYGLATRWARDMTFPISIVIHGIEPQHMLRAEVVERVERLDHYLDDILACRVLVETTSKPHQSCHYGVHVRVTLPCFEVEADSETIANFGHLDPYLTVAETFDVVTHRIEDFVQRRCMSCTRYTAPHRSA